MTQIKQCLFGILLLTNMNGYASSDDFFCGRSDPDKRLREDAERKRPQQQEEKKVSKVIRIPGERENAGPSSTSANSSSSSTSDRITLPAADIPVLDSGATSVTPDQEYLTDMSEIVVLGGFIHDLRNAAGILISILDFDIADIRSVPAGHVPENGIIRDLINQSNPRILETLLNTIMPRLHEIEAQLSRHRVLRRELLALMESISNWIKMIKKTQMPSIGIFTESLVDLERLTDDFSVYQTRHDVFRLTPTRVQIRELIAQISRIPFPQRNSDVDFRAQVHDDVPAEIIADATRLRQVVINLLFNAFKFTRMGRVTLSVKLSADGRSILFSVQDTGAGIAPEGISRIFDPLVQGPAGRAARTGLGLGLAIVKRLVNAFGGEIQVESVLGNGSTFHFSIPLTIP